MFPIAVLIAIVIGLFPLVLFSKDYNSTLPLATVSTLFNLIICFVLGINLGRYTFGDSRNQGTEILILSKPINRYQILVGRFAFLFIFCALIATFISTFDTIFLVLADAKVKTYFPNEYETRNLWSFINNIWVSLGICIFGGLLSGFIASFRNGKVLPVMLPFIFILILIIGLFYPIIVGGGMFVNPSQAIVNLYKQESDNKKTDATDTTSSGYYSNNKNELKAFRGSYDPYKKSKSNDFKNAYYQISDALNADVFNDAFSNLTNAPKDQAARLLPYINPIGLLVPSASLFGAPPNDDQSSSLDQIVKNVQWYNNSGAGSYTYDYNYDKNSTKYFPEIKNIVNANSYLIVPGNQNKQDLNNYVYLPNNYGIFVEDSWEVPVSLEYHVKSSDGSNFSKIFTSSPAATTDDYYFSANFLFSRILQTLANALLVSNDIQTSLNKYFDFVSSDIKPISFTDFSSNVLKAISGSKDDFLKELNQLVVLQDPNDTNNWLNQFFSPLIQQLENNYQGSTYNGFNDANYGFKVGTNSLTLKQRLLNEINSISQLINAITPANFELLISGYAALYFSIFSNYHQITSSITDFNDANYLGLKLDLSYDAKTQKSYDDKSLALPESLILGTYPKLGTNSNYYWWANSNYGINFETSTPTEDASTASGSTIKDPLFSLLGFVGNKTPAPTSGLLPPTPTYNGSDSTLVGQTYISALQDKNLWNTLPIEYAPNNELDKNFWAQTFTVTDSYHKNKDDVYQPFVLLPSSQIFFLTEANRVPTWAIAVLWTLISLSLIPAIGAIFLHRDYLELNN